MRRIAPLVAALGAVFAVTSAQAVTLVVDDFSMPIPGEIIFDNNGVADTAVTLAPSANATDRTLYHTLLTAGAVGMNGTGTLSSTGTGAAPNFLANQMNMANASDVDSMVKVEWTLASIVTGASPVSFLIDVKSNDNGVAGVNNVEAFLGVMSLGIQNATALTTLSFALTPAQAASLAVAGTKFSFLINGSNAWDMAIDNLRIDIPEPTSLALVGLALIGAGVVSRRRKA